MPKPRHVRLWTIVAIILCILIIPIIWISISYKAIVERKMPLWADQATDSLYDISVGDFEIQFLSGSVFMKDVKLWADTSRLKVLTDERNLSKKYLSIAADTFQAVGIQWWDLFRRKKFASRRLHMINPDIIVYATPDSLHTPDSLITPAGRMPIQVGQLQMYNPTLMFINTNLDSLSIVTQGGNLTLKDFVLKSGGGSDSIANLLQISEFTSDSLLIKQHGGNYHFRIGPVAFSEKRQECTIENIRLDLAMSREQFYRKSGQQTDLFEMHIPQITLEDLDGDALFSGNGIFAEHMKILDGELEIHMNRILPPSTISRIGNFPNQILQRCPFPIHIKNVEITDGDLRYTEIGYTSRRTGVVPFKAVNGTIRNITNIASVIADSSICTVSLETMAFGISPIDATFEFMLDNDRGEFHVFGHQGSMDVTQMNKTLSALAMVEVTSMQMDRLSVDISGDEKGARGNIILRYQDLEVRVLEMDGKEMEEKGLSTFMTNNIFINTDNPMEGKEVRKASVVVERDPYKSFFNLIWRCVFSGAVETGVRNEKIAKHFIAKPKLQDEERRQRGE